MAASRVYEVSWRFDGFGGVRGWEPGVEMGADGPLGRGRMSSLSREGGEASKDARLKTAQDETQRMLWARDGAMWTHWALARRMGADMEHEALRIQPLMGRSIGGALAPQFFASWSDAYPEVEKTVALAKARGLGAEQFLLMMSEAIEADRPRREGGRPGPKR